MRVSKWRRGAMVALAAVGLSGCGVYSMAGWTTPIENTGAQCEWVEAFSGGTEDIVVDPRGSGFYVSADPRREKMGQGGVWLVRQGEDGSWKPTDVTGEVPVPMHPHGFDLWQSPDGKDHRLFVINHGPPGEGSLTTAASRIEIFKILDDGRLEWLEGASYELLERPNALAAVGPRAFYAVNDHDSPRTARQQNPFAAENRETLSGRRGGSIVFVSDGQAKRAARGGLAFPAGVAVSKDGSRVFAGETSAGRISVYDRSPDNMLTLAFSRKTGPMPDNLTWTDQGVWYGAHSRLVRFLRHAVSPGVGSPGRVEVLDPVTGRRRLVLREAGKNLSTLSDGVPFGDKVIIGSIDQAKIGVCRLEGLQAGAPSAKR